MTLKITFKASLPKSAPSVAILPVSASRTLGALGKDLDKACKGLIAHSLKTARTFEGHHKETLTIALPGGAPYSQLVLVGLGEAGKICALGAENAGGAAAAALAALKADQAVLLADAPAGLKKGLSETALFAHMAYGLRLRAYDFRKYKSAPTPKAKEKTKGKKPSVLESVIVQSKQATATAKLYAALEAVSEGVYLARDLVNEPPNHLYPESYARRIEQELKPLGVEVEILDDKKLSKMGMGAIMAVGQGSARLPRLVVMRWNGGAKTSAKASKGAFPLALVGKGITFDTGGISIKPGAGMEEMKMDMGGSAAVVGTIKALALRKSKARVVGLVGLAENMPSHNAYRPGDIITSYSGKTIDILNTDAEGRLVLADVLTYAQKTYKPKTIIDLATLTGAMMVALGHEYCGTFSNDDPLWSALEDASRRSGEKLWRMPLDEVWKKDMVSPVADLQNLGQSGRFAGACTAAGFLEHFIEDGVKWAHMDIAGTAWRKSPLPTVPKFGTGFGVRVLSAYIESLEKA